MNTDFNKSNLEKLYLTDPYLKECAAVVTGCTKEEAGLRIHLDRTILYPGGGGQLPDSGTVSGSRILETSISDNQISYLIDKNVSLQKDAEVKLELDWEHRYYQMQQHTAQHLISALLASMGMPTVSVHLGAEYTMIEVSGRHPAEAELQQLEEEANTMVRRRLPVRSHFIKKEDIDKISLRREPGDYEILRVIEIEDLDFVACGGTHLENTSEIGLIKWIGTEKIRGHSRIKFLTGSRAYQYFRQLHEVQKDLREILRGDHLQFREKIEAIQHQTAVLKKEKKIYRRQYLELYIKTLAAQNGPLVKELAEDDVCDGAEIALKLAGEYSIPAFLYGGHRFFIALPEELGLDASEFLAEYKKQPGLKGGGSAELAQGKISLEYLPQIKESFLNFLNSK